MLFLNRALCAVYSVLFLNRALCAVYSVLFLNRALCAVYSVLLLNKALVLCCLFCAVSEQSACFVMFILHCF